MMRSVIIGWGAYLPEKVLTNNELAAIIDTSDEWIASRTGIRKRHIAAEGELTSDLASQAGEKAIQKAGLKASDIDLLIVATTTPDYTMPPTSAVVHAKLGMVNSAAFDMNVACSGFLYAVSTADAFIKSGQAKNVLVIGAETLSRILDWKDRGTCVLFGDGAGAVVLQGQQNTDKGILCSNMFCDGNLSHLITTSGGVSMNGQAGKVKMVGQEVFKNAVAKMSDSLLQALDTVNYKKDDIDWLIPHQANSRILTAIAARLAFPIDKVISTIDKHANTSAASIPLALCSGIEDGRVKSGNLLALQALGSGLTWGACLIKF